MDAAPHHENWKNQLFLAKSRLPLETSVKMLSHFYHSQPVQLD